MDKGNASLSYNSKAQSAADANKISPTLREAEATETLHVSKASPFAQRLEEKDLQNSKRY